MFHEDHSFRDWFMFGSVVLMALAAVPATRAAADEVYFCGDGRTLQFSHSDRSGATGRSDPCISDWAETARKAAAPAKRDGAVQRSESAQVLGSATLVYTATVVNAEEVPSHGPVRARKAEAPRVVPTAHEDRGGRRAPRSRSKGMRYVGDGIWAQ